ncbi:hypothetical protein N0O92_04975 [Alkalihalobacillus sp. MEB130]|uniref:hypothetical protein n=1 Tax=Alkalihalobacillus sp. MEB130 TaxID=2976704 RepID=UPI0028DEA6D2|nr:hypothetical protein [Alkalihalobacillus sp. MEB130]MDT8859578.1 hypothetical protein [Alkalihalobacillus sp. MEB130]
MDLRTVPVPMFKVNRQLEIVSTSQKAQEFFHSSSSFLELVDAESKQKVYNFLLSPTSNESFELNMKTRSNPFGLFQIYVQWEEEFGYVVCIEKDKEYQKSNQILHRLREQLHSIDFHEYEANIRKELLPSILNVKLSDLNRLSLSEYVGSLEDIPTKVDTVLDILSVLRPELIEAGKSEYLDIVTRELTDISSIIHYLLAASNRDRT